MYTITNTSRVAKMHFNRKILIITFVTVFILPAYVNADNFSTGPLCYKTSKPLLFSPEYLKQRYKEESNKYQLCIKNYIADQKRAIQLHQNSILQAEELLKE